MGVPRPDLDHAVRRALHEAAILSLRAPSIANSQPWRWVLRRDSLDLLADRARQLSLDHDGRLLTVSCGACLHHVEVGLAVRGLTAAVTLLPEEDQPDLLASVGVSGPHVATAADRRTNQGLRMRASDRRPYRSTTPVPEHVLAEIRQAATAYGVAVSTMEPEQVRFLGFAIDGAVTIEQHSMALEDTFADWSFRLQTVRERHPQRPAETGPGATVVPEHELAVLGANERKRGAEQFTAFVVLSTERDDLGEWLRAGQATSAALAAATAGGMSTSMMSEAVEVPGARVLLRSVTGKTRQPQLVLRVGVNDSPEPLPPSNRRPAEDVIEVLAEG